MSDREKIQAAIQMLKRLKRMVGFFMKRDIAELIDKLEESGQDQFVQKLNQAENDRS